MMKQPIENKNGRKDGNEDCTKRAYPYMERLKAWEFPPTHHKIADNQHRKSQDDGPSIVREIKKKLPVRRG